jgi:hypothetical protein
VNNDFLGQIFCLAGYILAILLIAAGGIVHVAYGLVVLRRNSSTTYRAFVRKWLFRRSLPAAVCVCLYVLSLVVGITAFCAWFRNRSIKKLEGKPLLVRVIDPIDRSGGLREKSERCFTTTNEVVISELLCAIRVSPTIPGLHCLCAGGRRFEIVRVGPYGYERTIETFGTCGRLGIEFECDWYGDWLLAPQSQVALVAWQERYVDGAGARGRAREATEAALQR